MYYFGTTEQYFRIENIRKTSATSVGNHRSQAGYGELIEKGSTRLAR
jgi:hypothetical protein